MLPGIDVDGGAAADLPFACSLVGTVAACGTTKQNLKHKHILSRNWMGLLLQFFVFIYLLRKMKKYIENGTVCRMFLSSVNTKGLHIEIIQFFSTESRTFIIFSLSGIK